ncbi:CHAT domain-containing protein [Algoriphagus litoralis]|uniref:CHAT domain-containing protein n=1 Tax=Algoriphagus litoralis TaxID=2202829 RepID=UPI000DBA1264|nr:CHAT domain-containing tetratricopeptide repeat protein [Algoriphagus litoralis]
MLKICGSVSIFILLFLTVWVLSFSQNKNPKLDQANLLYLSDSPSVEDDSLAILLYEQVLDLAPDPLEASAFVEAAERLGNLYQTYGKVEEAVKSYRKGFTLKRAYQLSDTLLYAHHLYLGEALFGLSKLDSSLYHLQQAEKLQEKITDSAQPERLNNALGVYFFETGNYIRSIAYFEKAESYLRSDQGEYEKYARYSFLSNKASALYRLEKFDSAQSIYSHLLDLGINTEQIRINLANTFIEAGETEKAIQVLEAVSRSYAEASTSYHNLMIKALLQRNEMDQIKNSLDLAEVVFEQDKISRHSLQRGIFLSLWGDYHQKRGEFPLALEFYQKAIVQLLPGFDDESVLTNPAEFSMGISSFTLFEILVKKAKTAWWLAEKDSNYFDLGLQTWRAAFGLAQFIAVNFDNDEARVFLGEKALEAFEEGIELLHHFAIQTNQPDLMREAFAWAEQSKANGLKVGAKQESIKRAHGLPEALIQEERNLLFSISRINQKQYGELSPETRKALESQMVDLQVKLSRLREKFKEFPGFDGKQESLFDPDSFIVSLPSGTALLSIFMSENFLFTFYVLDGDFSWKAISVEQIKLQAIDAWIQDIAKISGGNRYQLTEGITEFSNVLLGDLTTEISSAKELIIIPQGIFNSLPFELLPDHEGKLLLEKLPVSYQFSAQFVQPVALGFEQSRMLGYAPFSQSGSLNGFASLQTSSDELRPFGDRALLGPQATKASFMGNAPSAQVIHLATHAVASSEDPNQAFITFYGEEDDFRLFAPELAYQSLDQAKLIYLSACETGVGKLSNSEGLISLARSLSFAGAEQMVISLWVSEDRVSAYLANKFYAYALDGESFSNALRMAKLDLLRDPEMAQFHHPFFWANYRLIGQPSVASSSSGWLYPMVGFIILLFVGIWVWLVFYRQS